MDKSRGLFFYVPVHTMTVFYGMLTQLKQLRSERRSQNGPGGKGAFLKFETRMQGK